MVYDTGARKPRVYHTGWPLTFLNAARPIAQGTNFVCTCLCGDKSLANGQREEEGSPAKVSRRSALCPLSRHRDLASDSPRADLSPHNLIFADAHDDDDGRMEHLLTNPRYLNDFR